jgi:hypothetical protein
MKCTKELDVVLLIDGSASLGWEGWQAEIKTAELFVHAFSKAHIATILYSGPTSYKEVYACVGFRQHGNPKVDQEKDCKITTLNGFSSNLDEVMTNVKNLAVKVNGKSVNWPMGSTLTANALSRAETILSTGRPDAQSVVVVLTDGKPTWWNTGTAARNLRKKARLLWVAVTKYAPLKNIKKWASRPWQENVIEVPQLGMLKTSDVVNNIIADICPKKH